MLGCTGLFDPSNPNPSSSDESSKDTTAQDIYLHGYVSGRVFRHASKDGEEEEGTGLPMTISASLLDGLVLALSPFHNSCNYRSAIATGHATLVTSEAERLYAMRRITDNLIPGRWAASRSPPTAAELKSTSILKVRVAGASAKVRVGGPSEDRADLKDVGLREGTWTGVVPAWVQWGDLVEGAENRCTSEEAEGEVERWRVGENARARGYAYEAVQMDGKKK